MQVKQIIKSVYHHLPLKKQVFSALRTFWSPPESVYKHLHFKSVIKVEVEPGISFFIRHHGYQLENNIFWRGLTGGWEKVSMQLWIRLCRDAEVIFDIGANTGIYSLVAKALNPQSKVYAFEPVSRVYKKLEENIALNGFDIVPVEKAASNKNGKAIIYDTNTEHVYSVTVNKNLSLPETPVKETEIETVRLDTFINEHQVPPVQLLKIDVETHEPEVLEGLLPLLREHRPTLLIEILNNEVGNKVQELLKDLDYLYFNINERGGIRQVSSISASDYYNYLLCTKQTAQLLQLDELD